MTYSHILLERDGRLGRIVLNRPQILNGIDATMLAQCRAALAALQEGGGTDVVVLTGAGLWFSALPPWMITTGQVFIGISLGTRFRPGFFRRAPRPLGVALVSTLVGIPVTAAFGWGLGTLTGVAPATMVLATAPGGIAEMSLTAKMLALGVPVVTVFHVARVVFLVLAGNLVYRLIAARVGWPHVHARRAPVRAGDDD